MSVEDGVRRHTRGRPATRVFEAGWRGTSARTPGPGEGAGLGLAIVRGVAEAHGGEVSVANHGPGCRFVLSLPANPGLGWTRA